MSYRNTSHRGSGVLTRALVTLGKLVVVLIAWIAATAFGLFVAAEVPVGPVLVSLSATHGIHAGDVAAFGVAYVVAGAVTLALLVPSR